MRDASACARDRDRIGAGRGGSGHRQEHFGGAGTRRGDGGGAEADGDTCRLAARGQGNRRVKASRDSRGDDGIAAGALT